MDELPEEGFTPRLVDSYWAKGAAIMVCLEATKDWMASRLPTLESWEGSRLKIVGLDALPTYKSGGQVSGHHGGHGVLFATAL